MEDPLSALIHYMSVDGELTKNGRYPHLINSNIKNSVVHEDFGTPTC